VSFSTAGAQKSAFALNHLDALASLEVEETAVEKP
jgi:hypothetical protein